MKACLLRENLVFPYSMFITKIVKYFNVNLWNETKGKKLKSFDTYDRDSLCRLHFLSNKDGSWERKSFVPPLEVDVSSDDGSSNEENENEGIEERGIENENATEIPLNNGTGAKAVANHSSQIARNEAEASYNLNAQINSIGMHLEEMVLTNDGHLTSLECIDSF